MKNIKFVVILSFLLLPFAVFVLVPKPYRPPQVESVALAEEIPIHSAIYVCETIGPAPYAYYKRGNMSLASAYTAFGAGDAAWDGNYVDLGITYGGLPVFELGPFNLMYNNGMGWIMAQNIAGTAYYSNNGVDPLTITDPWATGVASAPAPTVVETSPPSASSGGMLLRRFHQQRRVGG